MDKRLAEFPVEGWDGIIKDEVENKIQYIFVNEETKTEISSTLMKALTKS